MTEGSKANQLRAAVAILTVLFLCSNLVKRGVAPSLPNVVDVEESKPSDDPWGFRLSIPSSLTGGEARQDAAMLSGLCEGIASILELDGKRQSPKIAYVIHIRDLRVTAILALLKGEPGQAPKYPEFNRIVGEAFGDSFPDGQEPLTDERRQEAVKMFQVLGEACRFGGGR